MTAFAKGDRVELQFTSDPITRLKPGDRGTVIRVTHADIGDTVDVKWDSGSSLSMLPDEGDRLVVVGRADT